MDNIITVDLGEKLVRSHEVTVVTEMRPEFLPLATLVHDEDGRALLYSRENLVPIAHYGRGAPPETDDISGLGMVFSLLTGYIRCLLSARDMLLDTKLLSSNPEEGVFLVRERYSGVKVKAVWGKDDLQNEGEKICRIAGTLAGFERVMGAKTSMERMIEIIRSENPSLINCLKAAESVCREWNHIVRAS